MDDEWYFARDTERRGPFSAQQLIELATSGQIQPTDTVWKAGIAKGVPAARVKRLFESAEIGVPEAAGELPRDPVAVSEQAGPAQTAQSAREALVPSVSSPPAPTTDKPTGLQKPPAKKGRAMAVRGAIIVGQDGEAVQYRKKCTKCGHEDASKSRMPIRHGMTRVGFFCPKCRKLMPVEIQGIL